MALVLVVGAVGSIGDDDEPGASSARSTDRSSRAVDPSPGTKDRKREKTPKPGPGKRDRDPKPPRTKPPAQRTYLVTRVVDGDTIELANGQTVRLLGIDTPEVGECGFERSSAVLEELVRYEQVRLTRAGDDRDQYDRLLRYVDVGTMDAGLRLIKRGLAIARYDSRDGYGYHPREPVYIAADERSPAISCPQPKPQPLIQAPPAGGGNCAPGYKPCIPPYPPDLDCGDVGGPVYVTGPDPHGLDADGDGVACEG